MPNKQFKEALSKFWQKVKRGTISNEHKHVRWIWRSTIGGMLFVVGALLWAGLTGLPSFEELENPKVDLATVINDDKGRQFGKYYIQNRELISFDSLNPHIYHALIATEDARFYKHSGIDLAALFRVGVKTLLLRDKSSGGGSTISQQLAKLLYKRPSMKGMGFVRRSITLVNTKLKEWITAVRLERNFTKDEIMAMYLNQFEFINGAHGIESASQIYFNKNQDQLSVQEASVLVGMLQNPSLYNPRRFPEKAKDRRNIVLLLMQNAGHISAEQLDSLSKSNIDMSKFNRSEQSDGPAPYFRAELTKYIKNLLDEENIRKSDGSEYNIYTDGLTINTTIDLDYQRYAEEAVFSHMDWLQKRFDRIWKGMDPWTHEADDYQRQLRQDIFISRMKSSERYESLRDRNLTAMLSAIEKKFRGLPTSDNVIKSLIAIGDGSSTFDQELKKGSLDKAYLDKYMKLIKSNDWSAYKATYNKHEAAFIAEFDKPVKMMLFDYEKGEKEMTMSPKDSVRYHNMFLQNATVAVDPKTGFVKAWVGGINHTYFKYDHATSRRSVGSTIKPFVYTAAMSVGGISPCQEFDDIQYTIAPGDGNFEVDKEWSPANATEEFTGNKYNLYHGLLYSKNSITVKLVKELGNVQVIRDLLNNLGINKNERIAGGHLAVPNLPSICLGAVDLRVIDMIGAYTAFANQGYYTKPVFIKNILDKNGRVLYTSIPERKQAINPLYNAVMIDMLQNNNKGEFSLGLKSPNGGKTGTTNDFADGWYMGVTPSLVVGVWTGGADKWIRFLTLDDGQGYVVARPIFQSFIKKLEKDTNEIYDPNASFAAPPQGFYELVDCDKYKTVRPSEERRQLLQEKAQKDEFDEEF